MALSNMTGRNLLNSQTPLLFLLADFPMLFVCSDITCWRLETGQGREGFGICTTHCPPHPHKALSSRSISGPLDQIACFQVPERYFSVCSPTKTALGLFFPKVGVASDRGCFETNLSSSSPPFSPSTPSKCKNILASLHHLGLVLEI